MQILGETSRLNGVARNHANSLSIVIPVYNSASQLSDLVSGITSVLEPMGRPYEVILVNDGSLDASWESILTLSEKSPKVHGINLMRNYGQHNAVLAGIRAAQHSIIVTMDDDLQHPPEEIPNLLAKIEQGFDVVYGVPRQEQHGLWRRVASQVTKMALKSAMGAETARNISAFRAFRAPIAKAFTQYNSPFVSIDVLLTWGTTRFAAVPVRHDPRRDAQSNYTFRKLVIHALNMLTGFSAIPLQIASLIGFTFTLVGLIILVYVLSQFVRNGGSVPGFPFLASIIAIFSGAELFALGIIGEYLARMHFRMMQRPAYAVRDDTAQREEDSSGAT